MDLEVVDLFTKRRAICSRALDTCTVVGSVKAGQKIEAENGCKYKTNAALISAGSCTGFYEVFTIRNRRAAAD